MEFLNKRSRCITRPVHYITRLSIIAPREPDLEIIKTNILTKSYDDYINNKDNEACLMDGESIVYTLSISLDYYSVVWCNLTQYTLDYGSNYGTGIIYIGNMLSWLSFHNFVWCSLNAHISIITQNIWDLFFKKKKQ